MPYHTQPSSNPTKDSFRRSRAVRPAYTPPPVQEYLRNYTHIKNGRVHTCSEIHSGPRYCSGCEAEEREAMEARYAKMAEARRAQSEEGNS